MTFLYVGLLNGKVHYATTDDETADLAKENLLFHFLMKDIKFKTFEITPELLEKIDSLNVSNTLE